VLARWQTKAHAAVNFGQYDQTSFPLNTPTIMRKPMPNDPNGAGWQVSAWSAAWQQQRQFSLASKRECCHCMMSKRFCGTGVVAACHAFDAATRPLLQFQAQHPAEP
jgi:hypothetical protein